MLTVEEAPVSLGERFHITQTLKEKSSTAAALAYDAQSDQTVYVRHVTEEGLDDECVIGRLEREADILSRLDHPGIPKLIDYQPGQYLASECLPGSNLSRKLHRWFSGPQQAARLCLRALEPLAYVHENGIVHRDVKDENLLFTFGGRVSLVDFEIAVCKGQPAIEAQSIFSPTYIHSSVTATGNVVGTAQTMAPEAAMGTGVTARSDVYSAGIVLYQLLAGQVPFSDKDSIKTAIKHIREPIDLWPITRCGTPDQLIDVVMTATAKNPAYRYESAGAMAEELQRAL